jgi:hypothetical protein
MTHIFARACRARGYALIWGHRSPPPRRGRVGEGGKLSPVGEGIGSAAGVAKRRAAESGIGLDTNADMCLEYFAAWQMRARTGVSQLGHAGGSWERSARRRRKIPYPTVGPHDGKYSHQCGDGRLSCRTYASNRWPWHEALGNPALPTHGPRARRIKRKLLCFGLPAPTR